MRVVFAPLAERQLDEIYAYIAERSGRERARTYLARIVSFCHGLGIFPLRGQKRSDLIPGLRTTVFERRVVVVFMVRSDTVLIEGIFSAGRDYETALRSADE